MVPVAADVVRPEIVGRLRQQESDCGLAPGTGGSRLAIGDEVFGVDDTGLDEGYEAQLDRRRIAAGIADDARATDLVAVELGQSVDRFGEKIGTRVRHLVPLLEHRDIADAKVGSEIDDLYAGVD